jgi:hypothetical protein
MAVTWYLLQTVVVDLKFIEFLRQVGVLNA